MKTIISTVFLLCIASCLASCGKVKETKKNLKDAKESIDNMSKLAKGATKAVGDMKKLAELEPLTNDDFKQWMPEQVAGLKRTSFKNNALGQMGVASSQATYKNEDDNKSVTVQIVDGAGTGSFAIAMYRMATNADMEEQTEYGYKKTVTYDGGKAMEEYKKKSDKTNLTFLYDERFGVGVETKGMAPKETWDLVNNLNLKKLAKLAR